MNSGVTVKFVDSGVVKSFSWPSISILPLICESEIFTGFSASDTMVPSATAWVNWLNGIRVVLVRESTELNSRSATSRIGTISQGANRGLGVPEPPPPSELDLRLNGLRSFELLSGIVHQSSHACRIWQAGLLIRRSVATDLSHIIGRVGACLDARY